MFTLAIQEVMLPLCVTFNIVTFADGGYPVIIIIHIQKRFMQPHPQSNRQRPISALQEGVLASLIFFLGSDKHRAVRFAI